MEQLTTAQVREQVQRSAATIVDVRPIEAYNGWRLQGEPRGGHIAGSRSLPAKWTRYIDWLDIVLGKGFLPDTPLILYGYDEDETEAVAAHFRRAGYERVDVYHHFLSQWSSDTELPVQSLSRYRQLVSARWLNMLQTTGTAPEYDNHSSVLCHVHYRNPRAYDEGHIPGAIALDTNQLESPQTWNRRSPEELTETLEAAGISHDTTVVLYGRFSFPNSDDPFPGSSAGHLAAMRAAFILLYAGVKDVRILNGGLQAWVDEGLPLSTRPTRPTPVEAFGVPIPQRPELVIDTPEAKDFLADPHKNLVSIRSWAEFVGQVSGYNYIVKKGRIPGAVFGNCGSDAYHMENYRNLDHTTREYHEIEALWAEAGITPDRHNAFYCGTGWRGSEAFVNAWLMGWPHIAVYDGGWFEWSNDENNPCETGLPVDAAPLLEAGSANRRQP